jgi:hypothetical protein
MSWKFMFDENIEVFKGIQELDYVEEIFKYLEIWTWIFYISTWDWWFHCLANFHTVATKKIRKFGNFIDLV